MRRSSIAVGLVALVVAFARAPDNLVWEEPLEFWARVPHMSSIAYLLEPWAGYLQVVARASFLIAHSADSVLLTRILGAAVVAGVAMFLASDRLEVAIPDWRVRIVFGLSIPFLPVAETYVGPLNSQWWLAMFLVGMALTVERRALDYPAVAIAGLSGVGACLALPVFRDRRGLVLAVATALQLSFVAISDRRPGGVGVSWQFALVAALVVLSAATPVLPLRTRLAFAWIALTTIAVGSWTIAGAEGGWRYLTPGLAFVALVVAAVLIRGFDQFKAGARPFHSRVRSP